MLLQFLMAHMLMNDAVFCLLQYNIPVHYHVNNCDVFVAMIAVHYFNVAQP